MAFKMKGHTLPGPKQRAFEDSSIINSAPRKYETQNGVKAFKDTTLEDGKAASSAFQIKSPIKDLFRGGNPEHNEAHDKHDKGEGPDPHEGEEEPALKHFVDDVPSHNDPPHFDDLQTDEEHKNGTRTHFPDGTKRSEREIAEYDENKAEEEKEKPAKNK